MTALAEDVAHLLDPKARIGAGGWWQVKCPAHEDSTASLGIKDGDRALILKCHAGCAFPAISSAIKERGISTLPDRPAKRCRPEIVATYDYTDQAGELLYQVVRMEPKTFRQRRPDGAGGWIWAVPADLRTLYHLPEVLAAAAEGGTVYVVEGEKDADALRSLGLVATCNSGGAGKWTPAYSAHLVGARVLVIPDRDEPGEKHGRQVLDMTPGAQVLRLPPPAKDAADWLARGGSRELLLALPPGDPEPTPDANPEPADFELDKHDRPSRQSVANIRIALDRLGVQLHYDAFQDRLISTRDGQSTALEDHHLDRYWIETDETFGFRPQQALYRTVALDYARQRTVHPVRQYLDGLTWDGLPRIDRWLIDSAGATDEPYTQAVSAIVLIAAVRRIRHPGCKFDEMLVLETAQGAGKSSALAALCPREEWFTDDLPMHSTAREVIERTAGCWIVEAAELSGMRKSEIEQVKAFLSRRSDRARLAYGRLPIERPRAFIVVGTTNSSQYLRDTTGNRRFWPLSVIEFRLDWIAQHRDQLWAEAAAREAEGESIRLPPELWDAAGQHQEGRRHVEAWEQVIDERLGDGPCLIATSDIWDLVGQELGRRTQADSIRIHEIMTRLGFEDTRRRKQNGSRVYAFVRGRATEWWVPPPASQPHGQDHGYRDD